MGHSAQLLDGIVQALDDPVAVLDSNFRLVYFNQAYADWLRLATGISLSEGAAASTELPLLPWTSPDEGARLWRCALAGEEFTQRVVWTHPHRGRRSCLARLIPLYDTVGESVRVCLIGRDLGTAEESPESGEIDLQSLRSDLQAQAAESEARFRGLFENAAVGMAVVSIDGELLQVNRKLCEMLGYAREELAGTDFRDYLHPEDRAADAEQMQWMLSSGGRSFYCDEKRFMHKLGQPIWVAVNASLQSASDGARQFVAVVHDITDRRQAELRLTRYAEELQRSNADLEEYATVASHDLQAPLRLVASFAGLLQRRFGAQLNDEARGYIREIVQNADRMRTMVTSLLDYSRQSQGGSVQAQPVAAAEALADALGNLGELLRDTNATIEFDELPIVAFDRECLVRLFQNLIENAIKHCPGRRPQVRIGARREGDSWVISVDDNGDGVDPRIRESIFELFRRGDSSAGGSGIGLAVCKKLVGRFGGRIWVEPRAAGGSSFRFTVSCVEETEPA